MAEAHYRAAGMPIGIIDAVDDTILVGVGWQDICVRFHRANPESLKRCRASDNYIVDHLVDGRACRYKCRNGLWDIGVPILAAGRHLATMFLGQFFYEGEVPERKFFMRQARKFGYDMDDYLAALDRVPVMPREKVEYIVEYNRALVGFINDIAERSLAKMKADEAVSRQRYFLEKAQELGHIGTWELDFERNAMAGTDELYRIFGFPVEKDLTYGDLLNRVHPDDRERIEIKREFLLGEKNRDVEYRLCVDGKVKWIRRKAEFEYNDKGVCVRATGVVQDITARKAAEESLRKLNEKLEVRIAERTAEIENRRRQLQRLALELTEAENRERQQIAAILHDDLQQELAYIKIEIGLMAKEAAVGSLAGKKLSFMERLIGECIDKSRNLSYEINPPGLSRNGLLTAMEALARDMKHNYGLEVRVRTQPEAEPDSLTLASILYRSARELLFNVVKHAGVTDAVMDVGCQDDMIFIRIEDFGNGFDHDTSRSSQGAGAGFGLYQIEDRITFLGGSMSVRTRPGRGCCIILIVPKYVSPTTDVDPPAPVDMFKKASGEIEQDAARCIMDDGTPIRILMADDHQLMREGLANLLQNFKGMTIVGQAVNGREVIDLANLLKPDVILMDVSMPEVDGIEATARISRNHPDIRIIGLSMHNDSVTRRKMFDAGADAYLTKTDSPDILAETIRRTRHGIA